MSLLVDVQKKMQLYSHQKVRNILDGEYGSVFKGRSMDFDDLREYILGDDVKDIDWKATARNRQPLIKRYIAVRKHNILLLVDTGKSMAASSPENTPKRDISLFVAGLFASIALKHGDLVSMIAGDSQNIKYMPLRGTAVHAERILQYIQRTTALSAAPSNLSKLLDYAIRTQSRRHMIVVISDEEVVSENIADQLRRLRAQHEVMYISVSDGLPFDRAIRNSLVYDVDTMFSSVPTLLRTDDSLWKEVVREYGKQWNESTNMLNRLAIAHTQIHSEKDVVAKILSLLERQRHVRSR